MTEDKLRRAKTFIDQKQYVKARRVLEGVPGLKADDWRNRLDGLILLAPPEQASSSRKWLIAVLPLVIAVVLVLLFIKLSVDGNNNARLAANESQATSALDVFCSVNTRLGSAYCYEYANTVIDADRSRIDTIMVCKMVADPILEGDSFASCLTGSRIPLPR